MHLTPQQVQEFFDTGYAVIPGVFKDTEIEEIRAAFARLYATAKTLKETQVIDGTQFVVENGQVQRVVWCCAAEPSLSKYGEDRRLTGPASQLLGSSEMQQLICQAHFKMPGDTVKFDWHQDSQHRGYGTPDWSDVNGKGSYVQTVIAVDAATTENGPLINRGPTGRGSGPRRSRRG